MVCYIIYNAEGGMNVQHNFSAYFKGISFRRYLLMLAGNLLIGVGISIFKLSGLGNDPFSGMTMALSDFLHIPYAHFWLLLNIVLFAIEFFAGRSFVGIGTIINACLLGYVSSFFYEVWLQMGLLPVEFWQQLVIVCIGVLVSSMGVSFYQTSNIGISPYDSLSLIINRRLPRVPYFWCRMSTDVLCAAICYAAGGIVSLGTLISAFGLAPLIHLSNKLVAVPLLAQKQTGAAEAAE